ncbi:MAG TPA: lipoprotein LipL21, partial [Leptospiraceae bacterium]|nr:lipoprotein LipL21 [Leptospiraceae bacterium]
MKKWYLIGAIALSSMVLYCGGSGNDARRDATSTGPDGWIFEGWACAPDAAKALLKQSPAQYCQDDKPKDFLYMKFSAAASQNAIDKGMVAMKQSTCRKAAKDQISSDGLAKILGEYLEQASGV